MLGSKTLIACILSLGAVASAQSEKFVKLSAVKRDDSDNQFAAELDYTEGDNIFLVEVNIGSENTTVPVIIDTNSDDLWVPSQTNPYCEAGDGFNNAPVNGTAIDSDDQIDCDDYAYFNSSESTTFKSTGQAFNIDYDNDEFAEGIIGTDDISIEGNVIEDYSFGVANYTNTPYGRLGLGYGNNSLPVKLANANFIERPAYSLNLDINGDAQILFGGIDKNQLQGSLYQFKNVVVDTDDTEMEAVAISLNQITLQKEDGSLTTIGQGNLPVVLDSSRNYLSLPQALYDAFSLSMGLDDGAISCDKITSSYLLFSFQGNVFTISAASLFRQEINGSNGDSSGTCTFQALPTDDSFPTFGTAFMRNFYTVVDLEAETVGLSYVQDSSSESIQVIDGGRLPGSVYPDSNVVFDKDHNEFKYYDGSNSFSTVTYSNVYTNTNTAYDDVTTVTDSPSATAAGTSASSAVASLTSSSRTNAADSLHGAGLVGLLPLALALLG